MCLRAEFVLSTVATVTGAIDKMRKIVAILFLGKKIMFQKVM